MTLEKGLLTNGQLEVREHDDSRFGGEVGGLVLDLSIEDHAFPGLPLCRLACDAEKGPAWYRQRELATKDIGNVVIGMGEDVAAGFEERECRRLHYRHAAQQSAAVRAQALVVCEVHGELWWMAVEEEGEDEPSAVVGTALRPEYERLPLDVLHLSAKRRVVVLELCDERELRRIQKHR